MTMARTADGTGLYYQVVGRPSGPPVLMIEGLGADLGSWTLQRLAFGPRFRTVVFDHRGVGRSDALSGPTSIEQLANDAVTVLDDAGIESAHVLGASMGGVIAQVLAVRYPERVRSLALACTACRHHPWRRELFAEWAYLARTDGMNEVVRRASRWIIGPRSMRRWSPMVGLLGSLAISASAETFAAQIDAILAMDDSWVEAGELGRIAVPTLVVVGNQDILTPRGDSEDLAERIPGAELVVISGAAHGLMIEHFWPFNQVLDGFWRRAIASYPTLPSAS